MTKLTSELLRDVERLYTDNLGAHGASATAVGWKDAAQQRLRFEKLAYVVDADAGAPSEMSVNDLGCGYGAMFGFLGERDRPALARYIGYDISPAMVTAAREVITDDRAVLVESASITETADYSFVSGTFNVRLGADVDAWTAYVRRMVLELAERSRRGFAFNLMTSHVDWRSDDLYYADPAEWLEFCKRQVSARVTLLHDYPLYEWTMAVFL